MVTRRSSEQKKVILKKGVRHVFEALWVGKTECVWEGVCVGVITAEKT